MELRDGEGRARVFAVPWAEVPWKRGTLKRGEKKYETASVGPGELRGWEVGPQSIYLERWAGGAR